MASSDPPTNSFGATAEDFVQLRLQNIVFLVPTTFVVYDYLLTSGREIRYIWRRGFSGPAILFYVMRYSALANAIFVVIDLKPWATMTDHDCAVAIIFQMTLDIILLTTVAVFSAMRAYALSGRNLTVLVVLIVLGIVNPAIVLFTFAEMDIGLDRLSANVGICGYDSIISDPAYENLMIGARASSVVVDMLVLVITWVQLWYMTRREMASSQVSPKSFAKVFLRDGTAYFLVLLVGNLIGLCVIRQFILLEPASTWISAFTAIMTWRFVLDLHEADDAWRSGSAIDSARENSTTGTPHWSFPEELVFRTEAQSVGVFGAVIGDMTPDGADEAGRGQWDEHSERSGGSRDMDTSGREDDYA